MLKLFGCVVGLCVAAHVVAEEGAWFADAHVMYLDSGIKVSIQEPKALPAGFSLSMAVKRHSSEVEEYFYHGNSDALEEIDHFLFSCKHRLYAECPHAIQEVAMVMVGDDAADRVLPLVQQHFGAIEYAEEPFWRLDTERCMTPFVLANNPSTTDSSEPFLQLPLTDKEKRFIKIIISTMAAKNIIQLAFEKHSLESKGDKIHHVHPMRFIGYILSNPDLRNDLKTIKKSSFKWDAFIDGFSKRMKEEFQGDNIYQYVPGFASQVGASQEEINHYIAKKDWEGLVKHLL